MHIVCAPDSFKQTLSGMDAARAMARGVERAGAEAGRPVTVDVCPVGDGGEGTLDALLGAKGGEVRTATVLDALGNPIAARFGFVQSHDIENMGMSGRAARIAIVELAEASGLARVPHSLRNPLNTTSFGTGQLVRSAIEAKADEIIICVGGSATVDGGAGMVQALGARFYNSRNELISEPITGAMLKQIARVAPPMGLPPMLVACDVVNPLLGPDGAAMVYGPQKGASPEQARELEEGLKHFASVIGGDPDVAGTGAAGGAAFGLAALCNAQLVRGIDLVLDAVQFRRRCKNASLVLTGEGRLDRQSLHGKACMGLANAAAGLGVRTVAIVGATGEGADECLQSHGGFLQDYISLTNRYGSERAKQETAGLIEQSAYDAVRAAIFALKM